MKLTDGFIAELVKRDGAAERFVSTVAEADGVVFECPKCRNHAVCCYFVGKVPDDLPPGPGRWTPSGTGIEDLTLSPSVHLTGPGCGWHGWVKNGSAT